MGGPILVVLLDIYACKMEEDIVAPSKPLLYKRYVDDIYIYIYIYQKEKE